MAILGVVIHALTDSMALLKEEPMVKKGEGGKGEGKKGRRRGEKEKEKEKEKRE